MPHILIFSLQIFLALLFCFSFSPHLSILLKTWSEWTAKKNNYLSIENTVAIIIVRIKLSKVNKAKKITSAILQNRSNESIIYIWFHLSLQGNLDPLHLVLEFTNNIGNSFNIRTSLACIFLLQNSSFFYVLLVL